MEPGDHIKNFTLMSKSPDGKCVLKCDCGKLFRSHVERIQNGKIEACISCTEIFRNQRCDERDREKQARDAAKPEPPAITKKHSITGAITLPVLGYRFREVLIRKYNLTIPLTEAQDLVTTALGLLPDALAHLEPLAINGLGMFSFKVNKRPDANGNFNLGIVFTPTKPLTNELNAYARETGFTSAFLESLATGTEYTGEPGEEG